MEASPDLTRQPETVRVLHSLERPGVTPVFGTTVPPSGLSGHLRQWAFRYPEDDLRHWTMLLLADRVNVGEGVVADLSQGRVPNVFAEMGLAMELRHNRATLLRRALVLSVLAGVGLWLLRRRRRR